METKRYFWVVWTGSKCAVMVHETWDTILRLCETGNIAAVIY